MSKSRSSILAGTAAILVLSGAALGAAVKSGAGSVTITVTAGKPSEYKFTLSKTTVPAGTVVFKVVNQGKKPHNFVIAGKKTALIAPGKSSTLTIVFQTKGRFAYSSSVLGQSSMKGVFNVTATPPSPTATQPTVTVAPPAPTCANPTATTVNVSLFEFGITLSQASFSCGSVTFMVTNTGTVNHSFDVVGVTAGPVLAAGASMTLTGNFTKSGSFSYRCDVGNHASQGMAGVLTVT
jgi:plastocyanin